MANFLLKPGHTYQARIWQSWGVNQSEQRLAPALAMLGATGVHVYPTAGALPSTWPLDRRADNAPSPAVTTWVEFTWPQAAPELNVDLAHPGIETQWYVGDIWESPVWTPAEPVRKGGGWVPAVMLGAGAGVAALSAVADRRTVRRNPSTGATIAWAAFAGGVGLMVGTGLGYAVGLLVAFQNASAGMKEAKAELDAIQPAQSDVIAQAASGKKSRVRVRYTVGNWPFEIFWEQPYTIDAENALKVWANYWARTLQAFYASKWGVYPGLIAVDVVHVRSDGTSYPEDVATVEPPWVARV